MSDHVDETVSVTKEDLVAKILAKVQIIMEQVDLDSPRLDFLFDEIDKVDYPLHVFNCLKKLWINVEHEPIFSYDIDDRFEFIELEFSYRYNQQKRDSFYQRAQEFLEIQNRILNDLPNYLTLDGLELEAMNLLLSKLENDQREYLECEFGKSLEKWEEEKLFEKSVELAHRMESVMAVVTQKLRDIALSHPQSQSTES
ncbi:unnamed protein product [Orchesella dallaii]|uniref:Uncharacterized protein n=1 Tax=Orchesella dallaii TaxID=48710 RepID=A0ABP1RPB8_9HEXA